MATTPPLLRSKLRAPAALPDELPRTRLLGMLEDLTPGQILVATGPAGSGRSAVLAQWARSARPHVAWLTLDAGDRDRDRLHRHLAAATGTRTGPTLDPIIDALSGPDAPILVLDGTEHLLGGGAELIAELIRRLPDDSRVVFSGRDLSMVPSAHLDAAGRVIHVTAEDLRFDLDELTEMLTANGLDPAAARRLEQETEGWPAAVGLWLRDPFGAPASISAFIEQEVLAGLAPEVTGMLVETSVLDELEIDVCVSITDDPRCGRILTDLAAQNRLVSRPDPLVPTFHRHPCLTMYLRTALSLDPMTARHARSEAARHLEEAGRSADAIQHLVAAGKVNDANRLLHEAGSAFFRRSDSGALTTLTRQTSPTDFHTNIIAIWSLIVTGRPDEAEALASRLLRRWNDPHTAEHAELRTAQAFLAARSGRMRRASELAEEALTAYFELDREIILDSEIAAGLTGARTLIYTGEPEAARELLTRFAARPIVHAHQLRALDSVRSLADALLGHTAAAEAAARRALDLPWDDSGFWSAHFEAKVAMAIIRSRRGETCEARDYAAGALREAETAADQALVAIAHATRAIVEWPEDEGTAQEQLRLTQASCSGLEGADEFSFQILAWARANARVRLAQLSDRELEVLRLLPTHMRIEDMAEALFVSTNTVKHHLKSIYRKLEVGNRKGAVAEATRIGLLT